MYFLCFRLPLNEGLASYALEGAQLSSLQLDKFTVVSHPRYPGHRVRVKKTSFCDSTVNAYTGYLDVDQGAKHIFFYFFESRRNPDKDDVMMWINGGPGCSSSMGLLMELGPCSIDMDGSSSNGTVWNPYSWNEVANIFFLDQPVGVGFSYADYGETVQTTEAAAKNVHAFVTIFFETFKQFSGRRLHLSGESYGGRYLPVFASEIYDQNQIAKVEGRPTLNLQSVLIGNGITDISTLYAGRYEIECGTAALDVPFQSIKTCVRMKTALPRCQLAMRQGCIESFDTINCRAAVNFCDSELSTGMWASGRNVYDISKMCVGDDLCYAENTAIKKYLDLPETRKLLGVETPYNFSACSSMVGQNFNAHMDKWAVPTQYYVAGLLDRGIRVLIYAGTYDWQCNWVANKLWVDELEWSGKKEYTEVQWEDWFVGGSKAGEIKQTTLLTFAMVRGAGHMVPHDKPAESLALISHWIANGHLW
ncbi:peptidase S10 serine carboxypeptidase [Desarmillaria tabescens]|uniref:Carboxypeptidase n=1 Tax=Armillaria tabescens TaxID=1929756 RepID=A0AA39NLA4_ARMTA|nr:peptidase S10 serine carboxypeptidase [Desarmillaria tabescens]KAK0467717.1 peptidase S10 serine carboxypeptidase [Desarmillaria tabescens]